MTEEDQTEKSFRNLSISKGVFLHKGRRKRPNPNQYLPDGLSGEQLQQWQEVWGFMEGKVEDIQSNVNSQIFGDLLEYIRGSQASFSPEAPVTSSKHEIPTAALVTGVNLPDHGILFSTLSELLNQLVTPYVVTLNSKDCPNVKAMVMRVMSALMSSHALLDDDDDGLDAHSVNMKLVSPSFSVLGKWYNMKVKQAGEDHSDDVIMSSPSKRRRPSTACSSPTKEAPRVQAREARRSVSVTVRTPSTPAAGVQPVTKPVSVALGSPVKPVCVLLRSPEKSPRKRGVSRPVKSPSKWSASLPTTPVKGRGPAGASVRVSTGTPLKSVNVVLGSSVRYSPIVLIITDTEAFAPHVLQEFITICSAHLHELPITLVAGVATTVQVLHRLLPYSVTALLSIDKFLAPPSSQHLSHVLDQILLTPSIPFRLGGKVYACLLDLFLYHEFSVQRYLQYLKYCVMEHFLTSPAAVLCHAELSRTQVLLTSAQMKAIEKLPSFQEFLQQPRDPSSHKETQALVWSCVANLRDYHAKFFPILRCLHTLVSRLPQHPLGKQIREIYAKCLSRSIFEDKEYDFVLQLCRSLSRDELVQALQTCISNLHSETSPGEFLEILSELQTFIDQLNNVEALQRKADEEREKSLEEKPELPKKTNIYELRKTLQQFEEKKRKFSVFDSLRNSIIEYLDNMFRKYLICPQTLPLYEAFYFNDVSTVKQALVPCPRGTLHRALDEPQYYIKNDLLADTDGISPTLPDLSIAFKLHKECGRFINLYDWLQAFAAIKNDGQDEDKQIDAVTHAAFIRSVSELQFLGFIKPTKRKTDHVARLTWGAC